MTLRELWNLLTEAYGHWGADRANRMAAALSFSITLSSAPLLVVGIAVAGLVLEQESVQQTLAAELAGILGEGAAEFVQAVLASTIQVVSRSGLVPPAVALVVTFLGASGVVGALRGVLDDLWGVRPRPRLGLVENIVGTVKERLFYLAVALGVGLALLASLAVNTLVAGAIRYVAQVLPVSEFMVRLGNLLVWTVVATFVFAAMFCAIPDVRIARRDALLGAAVTSILFNLGQFGISIYLAFSTVTSVYGAAGSIVVILLWIYYSAQVFLYGAELTQLYADRYGQGIHPSPEAYAVRYDRVSAGVPVDAESPETPARV